MRLFLLSFFLIYGLMHIYAFIKAKAAVLFVRRTGIYIAVFMLLMMFTPFIVFRAERLGFELTARVLSYAGYTWMGFLFLFFVQAVLIDVYRLAVHGIGLVFQRDLSHVSMSAGRSFFIPAFLSLAICVYGYFEAQNINTEHVILKTSKLPAHVNKLTIVQISDVHVGLIVREERLKNIISRVKAAGPDILVCTGDLVDGQINKLTGLAEIFHEINPRYGKFAITGNHEFYAGIQQSLQFIQKAGFKALRGEAVDVEGIINIAGVDDPTVNINDLLGKRSEKELLSGLDHGRFTLLLKHRPVADKDAAGLFDLQLSGHTHKGQIFPFSLVTKFYYPKDAGMLHLVDHSYLYVSRGSGTWGPPVRFLSPPEVTVIELVRD